MENPYEEMKDLFTKKLAANGLPVRMGTPLCDAHLAANPSCQGCCSAKACKRLNALFLTMKTAAVIGVSLKSLGEMEKLQEETSNRVAALCGEPGYTLPEAFKDLA